MHRGDYCILPGDESRVRPDAFGGTGKSKALFLDRDGVINVERCYLYLRDDFEFVDGIFEVCQAAQVLGYLPVIVTNQAGIARGFYTEDQFLDLMVWVLEQFAARGILVAGVYYCPYHPVHGVGRYKADSPDRKPRPGMLLRAAADLNLDLASSVLIGDQASDIEAARAAGIGTRILLTQDSAGIGMSEEQYCECHSLDEVRFRYFAPADWSARPHTGVAPL
jgi:D-glycero-D-manno-heptose 1,7-bisphosphate phosphatase